MWGGGCLSVSRGGRTARREISDVSGPENIADHADHRSSVKLPPRKATKSVLLVMDTLVKGLRASARSSAGLRVAQLQTHRSFVVSPAFRAHNRPSPSFPLRLVRLQNRPSPVFPHSLRSVLPNIPRQSLYYSTRADAEDPRTYKPVSYPEAEWQKVNDEFEQRLAKRSWFFRPVWRAMGHPKYFAGNVTMQFFLIGSLISGWIYIWFFMGYAPAPVPKDGTGRDLTDEEIAEMETIENYLHSHPVVQAIRSQKYLIESRPHWAIPDKDIPHNLTGGTLRGLGRISVAPIAFADGEGKEFYAVLHVGKDLCGNRGFVHDGLLAMVVDESLARCCFPALPNRIGVTANLNIDYKEPVPADSYLLVKVGPLLRSADNRQKHLDWKGEKRGWRQRWNH